MRVPSLWPRVGTSTVGLAIGIAAAVTAASAIGAWLFSSHHFESLLQNERATALAEGELMRTAVEHQMIEHERSLIAELVRRLGREPRVVNLLLLDRKGEVKYSSVPVTTPAEFQLASPTCQACHRLPPDQRGSSRVLDTAGGTILRTVIPIRNRPACYDCHTADQRINGVLIYDRNVGELRASMDRDLRWFVAGAGGLALALIGAIALIVRLVVLRRLQRFETTARQIAAGHLNQRVPAEGSDTISWLAREFNTMADSVSGLVLNLRDERERLETVLNSIDDGIVVLDANRKVVAANDAFLRRSGHERDRVLGCSCTDLAGHACASAGECPTAACLRSGDHQIRICERPAGDGAVRWEEVHASPVRGETGELVQVVEVWRDITDRRAAEARLSESHRMASLGMLASGFSHELNTPLGTVLTCVEAILRESRVEGGSSPVGEHAAIARDQILRCRGITQNFLRLSRGQRSAAVLLDLAAAMAVVVRLIAPSAKARGVHVDTAPMPERLTVCVDEAELQHAVMNLLLNAVQASAPGSTVTLRVVEGSPIRIEVIDRGCGIPSDQLRRVFEPFFSMRSGGTGLGLFVSLNCARGWGGEITVSSTPGAGSTFIVTIPPASTMIVHASPSLASVDAGGTRPGMAR